MVVVSNIFYFHPYLEKIPILTGAYFSKGLKLNHQLVNGFMTDFDVPVPMYTYVKSLYKPYIVGIYG